MSPTDLLVAKWTFSQWDISQQKNAAWLEEEPYKFHAVMSVLTRFVKKADSQLIDFDSILAGDARVDDLRICFGNQDHAPDIFL